MQAVSYATPAAHCSGNKKTVKTYICVFMKFDIRNKNRNNNCGCFILI